MRSQGEASSEQATCKRVQGVCGSSSCKNVACLLRTANKQTNMHRYTQKESIVLDRHGEGR